jgi:hypothetical protein
MRPLTTTLCALCFLVSIGCATFTGANHLVRVAGVVEEPRSDLLRVRTRYQDIREVRLDAKTSYRKWITHQPWTLDKVVTRESLTVGRCVNILLRPDESAVAKLVEISLDHAGDPQEPCKQIR